MDAYAAQFQPTAKTHIDGYDRAARTALAHKLGVPETRVAKAVKIVGSRISTIRAYLMK